jgi:hypothetical protein
MISYEYCRLSGFAAAGYFMGNTHVEYVPEANLRAYMDPNVHRRYGFSSYTTPYIGPAMGRAAEEYGPPRSNYAI